jgi:hypothetical protein
LLGLAKAEAFEIQAVDRSDEAIAQTQALLARVGVTAPVAFLRDAGESWKQPDLTVVATQAAVRPALVDALLAHGHRTLVLEKLVCQREADYDRLIATTAAAGARAWVVAPLRYNAFYQSLEERVHGQLMALQVTGADLGLATNVIHFADLFTRLRGSWSVHFENSLIAPEILPNKRGGDLVEFGGTLAGRDSSGSTLSVTNLGFGQPTQNIVVTTEQLWCLVDVPAGCAHVARRDNGWRVETTPYGESFVSAVTPLAARDILATGACGFPTLEAMRPLHHELFRVFRAHLAAVRGGAPDLLPIT